MRKATFFLILAAASVLSVSGQTASKPRTTAPKRTVDLPSAVPAKRIPEKSNSYTNAPLGFEISFPSYWTISDEKFEQAVRDSGLDLGLKAPDNISTVNKIRMERSLKNVSVLVTAYRSKDAQTRSAIIRVSSEDLTMNPQIKDAIDYFDAIRSEYRKMALPADLKYSDTQAEQLGKWQFAFLDIFSTSGKKRLYATVRRGHAIILALSYDDDADLQTMREILARGNFALKP